MGISQWLGRFSVGSPEEIRAAYAESVSAITLPVGCAFGCKFNIPPREITVTPGAGGRGRVYQWRGREFFFPVGFDLYPFTLKVLCSEEPHDRHDPRFPQDVRCQRPIDSLLWCTTATCSTSWILERSEYFSRYSSSLKTFCWSADQIYAQFVNRRDVMEFCLAVWELSQELYERGVIATLLDEKGQLPWNRVWRKAYYYWILRRFELHSVPREWWRDLLVADDAVGSTQAAYRLIGSYEQLKWQLLMPLLERRKARENGTAQPFAWRTDD